MSRDLPEPVLDDVRELICRISGLERGTDRFIEVQKLIVTTLKKASTMNFLNRKDIEREIGKMAEKFAFHGFSMHGDKLKALSDEYLPKILPESELHFRLNVVRFLLCMSESPTTQFWQNPDKFNFISRVKIKEEVIDWKEYLNKGIERWSPPPGDSSSSDEESTEKSSHPISPVIGDGTSVSASDVKIYESEVQEPYDFRVCNKELLAETQHTWYYAEKIQDKPPSNWYEANVGVLWDKYLISQVMEMVHIEPVSIISEYKVMREIMWQMWGPHTSAVFELKGNTLVPKENITIPSVRAPTFQHFLKAFIPYIEVLDDFRKFCDKLNSKWLSVDLCESQLFPETYHNFGRATKNIINPIFWELVRIEDEVRKQETTITLLTLAHRFESVFQPIQQLKKIHIDLSLDFKPTSTFLGALDLLTHLRSSLNCCVTKIEQDMRLSLYCESLYYYMKMVDSWLVKNDLSDYTAEFIIVNKCGPLDRDTSRVSSMDGDSDWEMQYTLQGNVQFFLETDQMMGIIGNRVLQIGTNLHLLRLLGQHDVIVKSSEAIHEEFVRRLLLELCKYYGKSYDELCANTFTEASQEANEDETDFFEDYVDTSDGFLMKAFENYLKPSATSQNRAFLGTQKSKTLFEKISSITTNFFPLQQLPETIFAEILRERFTISGLLVKKLLVEKYALDRLFEFLNHIYLFGDDLIFPFYRRFFERLEEHNKNWGNSVWLTSHLHDVILDAYPKRYEDCSVQVGQHWRHSRDSLEACATIHIGYVVKRPLDIIVTESHMALYRHLFHFILKIKWALYTINHIYFSDMKSVNEQNARKLMVLRFSLNNILNSIQHYVFGVIFNTCRAKFELDFEKANDLQSLKAAHADYINAVYSNTMDIWQKDEFNTVMLCVKSLRRISTNGERATSDYLEECHQMYKTAFRALDAIVNPISTLYC